MTYLVPLLLALTATFALFRRVDVYSTLTDGAREGLTVLSGIFPSLVGLLTAVYMLRASGVMELVGEFLSPLLEHVGIPQEVAPLLLIRPVSGSAALAVGSELMSAHGVDSTIGRIAAVMLGSSETTFYTIAVYFGSVGIRRTRYAVPAALIADVVCFVSSALAVRLFF